MSYKYKPYHKLSILFLKYIVILGTLIMYIHNILLLTNTELVIADWVISLPLFPYIVAMTWSKVFGFCSLHRACLTYIMVMTYCIKYQTLIGFGKWLVPARFFMFSVGTILLVWWILHDCKLYKSKKCVCIK